jgi:hypothetical protein
MLTSSRRERTSFPVLYELGTIGRHQTVLVMVKLEAGYWLMWRSE